MACDGYLGVTADSNTRCFTEQQYKVIHSTWHRALQRLHIHATNRHLKTSAKCKSALGRAGSVTAVWAIIKRSLAPWKINWDEPVTLWLMLLQTPRWLAPGVRRSPKPKGYHGAVWAPLPHLLPACSAATGAAHHSQETGATKPNFLIPASVWCGGFRSNSKLHHMMIHLNGLQPREDARVAASPLPQEAFLSLFCSAEHLKACTLDFPCGLCTKWAINS